MEHIKPNHIVQQHWSRSQAGHTGKARHTARRGIERAERDPPLALPLSSRVLVRLYLIVEGVDHVAAVGVNGLGRPDHFKLGHAGRARVGTLSALEAQHRPFLRLVADIQQNTREFQCLVTVDTDAKANVAPADDICERRVDHTLQDPAPTNPCSLVGPRILELPYDGDVRDGHPLRRVRDVVDQTDAKRVQFVGWERASHQCSKTKKSNNKTPVSGWWQGHKDRIVDAMADPPGM